MYTALALSTVELQSISIVPTSHISGKLHVSTSRTIIPNFIHRHTPVEAWYHQSWLMTVVFHVFHRITHFENRGHRELHHWALIHQTSQNQEQGTMSHIFPRLAVNYNKTTTSAKWERRQSILSFNAYKPCKTSDLTPSTAVILKVLFLLLCQNIPYTNDLIITLSWDVSVVFAAYGICTHAPPLANSLPSWLKRTQLIAPLIPVNCAYFVYTYVRLVL